MEKLLSYLDYSTWRLILAIAVAILAYFIFRFLLNAFVKRYSPQNIAVTIIMGLSKFILWVAILILVLDNLGVKIVSLVAGLGIGGIAIALAAQRILGDLFASISVMLDKPFEVGDLIHTGTIKGYVESIGIRATKIRSIKGEQVIIANSDLLESRVLNFKRMTERRIDFDINISSETSNQDLKSIVDMVKNIIDNQSDARFDRGHLKSFSASSVDYEIVFWVTKPDYLTYMNVQEKINIAILDALDERKINLAYPAQRVLLGKD
jgi:small-conductance mechanosensitive channel